MKIRHEIAQFLAHKMEKGCKPRSVYICKLALRALLGPVLDEPGAALTRERMGELGGKLRQRPSPRTGKPLAEGSVKSYLAAGRAFMKWRSLRLALQGSASVEPQASEPSAPRAAADAGDPRHAGELVRQLREDAGLLRSELGQQTGLSVAILRNLERGMSAAPQIWRALLAHPSMAELPEMAKQAGIPLEVRLRRGRPPTVEEAIGLYLDRQHHREVKESSLRTCAAVLRSVFRPVLAEPLTSLYPTRARELVEGLPARMAQNKGKPLEELTREAYRQQAHAFLGWCVRQRRLPANPLARPGMNRSATPERSAADLAGTADPTGKE